MNKMIEDAESRLDAYNKTVEENLKKGISPKIAGILASGPFIKKTIVRKCVDDKEVNQGISEAMGYGNKNGRRTGD